MTVSEYVDLLGDCQFVTINLVKKNCFLLQVVVVGSGLRWLIVCTNPNIN